MLSHLHLLVKVKGAENTRGAFRDARTSEYYLFYNDTQANMYNPILTISFS